MPNDESSPPVVDGSRLQDQSTERSAGHGWFMAATIGVALCGAIAAGASRWHVSGIDWPEQIELMLGIFLVTLLWLSRERAYRRLARQLDQVRQEGASAEERSQAATARLEREVAEHRRTLERLRASERNYRNVFENTGTATIIIDPNLLITRVNTEFTTLIGLPRSEVEYQRRLTDFVADETARRLIDRVAGIPPTSDRPSETEFTLIGRSGRDKRVVMQVGRIPGSSTFVASLSDVTDIMRGEKERRQLEAQLHQAQRMEAIGTLAGGIAHDFNNLMMGMLGNLSLVVAELGDDHPCLEKIGNVESLIHSGAKLTGQLLGYARKGTYEVQQIDLNGVIRNTSETIGRTMKGITLTLDLSPRIEAVCADPGQMEQVLVNLMVNAADAMPTGGSLHLASDLVSHKDFSGAQYKPKPGRYVRLTVTDTGLGMDAATLSRIFDPFFTTKEMGRGTGLGLASVYGIIKGHGGYIDAVSTPGEGTAFTVCLPASGPLPGVPAPPVCQWSGGGSETILVVDDEPMVNEVTTGMLTAAGYCVLSARNGHEALDIFGAEGDAIDLVIMDMVMPGLSGEALFSRLRALDSNVHVLVSSGYAMDSKTEALLRQGAEGFIQKPFDMSTLGKRIREILDIGRVAA